MQARFSSVVLSLVALTALSSVALAGHRAAPGRGGALAPAECERLRAIPESGLGALRAGAVASPPAIQAEERTALSAASARDSDLGALRAGDITLSDHDVQLIVIVAAVVLILIII